MIEGFCGTKAKYILKKRIAFLPSWFEKRDDISQQGVAHSLQFCGIYKG